MLTFLIIFHVLLILLIIVLVLLQAGKGAEIGAVFGGPSTQTLFGGAGAGTILTRITTGAIFLFMLTSLGIVYFSSRESSKTLMPLLKPSQGGSVTSPTSSEKSADQKVTSPALDQSSPATSR